MKGRSRHWLAIAVFSMGILVVEPPPSHAEGWLKNPFASGSKTTRSRKNDQSWWSNWKAPWTSSKSKSMRSTSSSTWSKMSKGTKRWWDATTDALDPFPDDKPASSTRNNPKESSSFWPWGKKEESKVENMHDFMGLQRPDF